MCSNASRSPGWVKCWRKVKRNAGWSSQGNSGGGVESETSSGIGTPFARVRSGSEGHSSGPGRLHGIEGTLPLSGVSYRRINGLASDSLSNTRKPHYPRLGRLPPRLGGSPPRLGRSRPRLGGSAPGRGWSRPRLGRSRPRLGQTAPHQGPTCPRLGRTVPGRGSSGPSVGESRPSVGGSAPSVQK